VVPGARGQHPAARCALEEALLDQIGLDDVLDSVTRFRQAGGDGFDPHRSAAEIAHDHVEIAPVELIEPDAVNRETGQRLIGDLPGHRLGLGHFREIPHPPQQAPGDAWGTPGSSGEFMCAIFTGYKM